ncbi:MAG TPA: DNA-3-methyladenine glycosylase [Smithellaceae bacterium]|nr:DNA-3-methyladenine glycosylase [Smithellaceae bacterium]HRS88801.1 DNA-3-methyladenine glycosylase [Smithellaceae bacterium]HRV25763.1 DNA-3-methyladenine glycosylase [Smithellaceae bacterium]
MSVLKRDFYERDTKIVARALLGKRLVRKIGRVTMAGMILETEAYCGREDSACHAHRGRTARNAVMFGAAGHAYVYFTYGMHYMLNLVTEDEDNPSAVLIRAIAPIDGIEEMKARRKIHGAKLADGPAKLCQALAIDKSLNGWDVTRGEKLWVEDYKRIRAKAILATPRIGINYATKEHRDALWRYLILPGKIKG